MISLESQEQPGIQSFKADGNHSRRLPTDREGTENPCVGRSIPLPGTINKGLVGYHILKSSGLGTIWGRFQRFPVSEVPGARPMFIVFSPYRSELTLPLALGLGSNPPSAPNARSFFSSQQLTPIHVARDHGLITKTLGQVRSIRPASCPRTGTKGRNVRRRQLREIGSSNQASAFWSVRPSKGVVRQKAIRSRFYGSPVIRAGCDVICL